MCIRDSTCTEAKAFEAKSAVSLGAQEIDMVINIGALKDQNFNFVEQDIAAVKKACGPALLKVIIETCLLTDAEKVIACKLAVKAGADYVKTSTGFSNGGATVEDIALDVYKRQLINDCSLLIFRYFCFTKWLA